MKSISLNTFAALEANSEADFVLRLGSVLRESVPCLENEAEPEFSNQLVELVRQARRYELTNEQSIGAYAAAAALLGLNFVKQFQGVRQILESRETEDRKVELLEAFTLDLLETLER